MPSQWDLKALHSRIADPIAYRRHAAGSPDDREIARYGRYLRDAFSRRRRSMGRHVVVLGMTPELRRLALESRCGVTAVDCNTEAIELYQEWTPAELRHNERVIRADWLDLETVLDEPADAVLGDGVFGNLLSLDDHHRLLQALLAVLAPEGVIILRKILVPNGFPLLEHSAERLLTRFRAGELTEAEFGFGMRIFGSYRDCYDPETYLLDNALVFQRYRKWAASGLLTAEEHEAIKRYYFAGRNLIPPQSVWEGILAEHGLSFHQFPLRGRLWYQYYRIYYCHRFDEPWMGGNIRSGGPGRTEAG